MRTKFIEATDATEFNWGKFAVMWWEPEEWTRQSKIDNGRRLLAAIGRAPQEIYVMDLQTGEGALFRPGGVAKADLDKHRIWVCPMFEPFLAWLYEQDLRDIGALPSTVNLGNVATSLRGFRREGSKNDDRQ
jgi:hypothetical protein